MQFHESTLVTVSMSESDNQHGNKLQAWSIFTNQNEIPEAITLLNFTDEDLQIIQVFPLSWIRCLTSTVCRLFTWMGYSVSFVDRFYPVVKSIIERPATTVRKREEK